MFRPVSMIARMIESVNDREAHTGTRLLDFFDSRSPWNRRLWNSGLSLTLREVLEAATACRAGILSKRSLGFLVGTAHELVRTDPGVGIREEETVLHRALQSNLRMGSLDYHVVAQQELRVRTEYLARWAKELRGPEPPRPERAARAIASHLLDIGYSPNYLHRWWKYRLHHEPGIRSIADIVDDAQQLATKCWSKFEVMAPVTRAIRLKDARPPREWRSAGEVSAWLHGNGSDVKDIRQDGGFLFEFLAPDSEAAIARVSEILDQLSARVAVGARRGLAVLGRVWIRGNAKPRETAHAKRGVWIEALDRENQLYDAHATQLYDAHAARGIHAAIELLSHLQSSSPGAAVAGGWAAIEALLSESEDHAEAADRLAMLVACSYPRAELTALSYDIRRLDTGLKERLHGIDENRKRCEIVADALQKREIDLNVLSDSDRATAVRILRVIDEPRQVLVDVQKYAANAFHRLYRQRNLVLHGGQTNAVALRASLRTAAPIVGAGIDRIVHAVYVDKLSPLQLVARAKLALATVGTPSGPRITDLLGRDTP